MSQTFAQFVPADPPRPHAGTPGNFASAPHLRRAAEGKRSILRLEIRRSLQVHRRLAVGLALVGAALALIYLLNSWTMRTAPNMAEPQPARIRQSNEFRAMTAMGPLPGLRQYAGRDTRAGRPLTNSIGTGSKPGFAGLAAAVVPPWYLADSGVLRNALVLLLSFVFLGGAIAVVAHRADPRVYIAADVEQLLGFPPMAQLPDFSEVADEIADEHLLRLTSGIDLGFKDRGFRRCVLTGTGPGVGVTTVATRLKKLLETTGRAAVIENAAVTSGPAFREMASEPNRQPNLLEWVKRTEEMRAEQIQGEMVLVDAAPLADSEDAERLVRSADCTIVVIESGITTRAQLRTVANILQRTKAPAVGFVLNRVRLATADPEFRRSIREMGKQLRKQGQATDWQMLRTLEQAIEEGRASLDLDMAAGPILPAEKPLEKFAASVSPSGEFSAANTTVPANPSELAVPAEMHGIQLVKRSLAEPMNQQEEIPLPTAEVAPQFRVAEPMTQQNEAQLAAAGGTFGGGTSYEPANPMPNAVLAPEKTTHVTLPRLSDLRGMRFSQAIRELDHAKRPASPSSGIEMLMNAIAPFEPMFTRMEAAAATDEDSPEATTGEFDLPESLRALLPISEPGNSPEAMGGMSANSAAANGNHLPSNSVSLNPEQAKSMGPREEAAEQSSAQNAAKQKLRGPFEPLQILPSRRGQYKKKS